MVWEVMTRSHHLAYCKDNERIAVAISPLVCGVKAAIYFREISEKQNWQSETAEEVGCCV